MRVVNIGSGIHASIDDYLAIRGGLRAGRARSTVAAMPLEMISVMPSQPDSGMASVLLQGGPQHHDHDDPDKTGEDA
jgi:hypothetical protein